MVTERSERGREDNGYSTIIAWKDEQYQQALPRRPQAKSGQPARQ